MAQRARALTEPPGEAGDTWATWLEQRRHGGDAAAAELAAGELRGIRDRVLDAAALQPGMTLADLGSGDGLVAFGALERIGRGLRVVFVDISLPLLSQCTRRAESDDVRAQCDFVNASADRLDAFRGACVDAVTSRAVLAYVEDKPRAFAEVYRILKPGGRLSAAEPIMRDQALEALAMKKASQASGGLPGTEMLDFMQRWKSAQFPISDEALQQHPLVNYTERDLVRWAGAAGFQRVRLELHVDVQPAPPTSWSTFAATAPHPWAPTLAEILSGQFTASERLHFESLLRPMIESGRWMSVGVVAYLVAVK
jgi:ubiquinone/menaquinone biosynthesis C-methylase UbiE